MSSSSLWTIDNDYRGTRAVEYANSWLFTCAICEILFKKYLHTQENWLFNYEKFFPELNDAINNSGVMYDRICFELTNQYRYDEGEDECTDFALSELQERVTEFVIIKDGGMEFVDNISYFQQLRKEESSLCNGCCVRKDEAPPCNGCAPDICTPENKKECDEYQDWEKQYYGIN